MNRNLRLSCLFPFGLVLALLVSSPSTAVRGQDQNAKAPRVNSEKKIEELAGNAEVAEILRSRPGRGVMADDSKPTPPDQALKLFKLPAGLSIELVASEPKISQPLFLSWDSAGRLWIIQYRQYQYPAGLKVVRFDQHLRAVFDKIPAAPPNHVPGADVISVLEDTDHDGVYDNQRDVITGLNIATSVAIGQGGIWVMNPPYLLFYPDQNQDCLPDADPEVHLSGFGLQDTHSVANSLMFGPDGWLYGANGSTTGGTVISGGSPAVAFEGQCIWRYHPASKKFEIYAEGGGNTFSLDIDAQGRVFSGTNGGGTRGWYYPQGSYSQKNWGKHGPLTNPFAFGFLNAMRFQGDDRRFPQAFLVYDGGLLGEGFEGSIIAPNSMCNLVWHSRRYPDGSSFRTVDEPNLVESSDRWFRPVYGGVGPDGSVYLADWYDTRLSHVSPVDDWHKESGRIYRVAPLKTQDPSVGSNIAKGTNQRLLPTFDLSKMSASQLIDQFKHPNKWVRQRASLELSWRSDKSQSGRLIALVREQGSLEALWALGSLHLLSSELATEFLNHSQSHIRRWTVRLLGDRGEGLNELGKLAAVESDVEVRSQLAATAKRIPTSFALPVVAGLLQHEEDIGDPTIPLMIWWALEAHAKDFDLIEQFLRDSKIWKSKITREIIAERLMQRYAATGTTQDIERCSRLLELPIDAQARDTMIGGLNKAFQGRSLPLSLPKAVQDALKAYRDARGSDGVILAAKQGDQAALQKSLAWLRDNKVDLGLRIEAATVLGQQRFAASVDPMVALAIGRGADDPALQRVALQALVNFDSDSVGKQLTAAFDSTISDEHSLRETASRTLASRKSWALMLLKELNEWRIRKKDVPADVVVQLRSYNDPVVLAEVERAFGKVQSISSPEQAAEIERLSQIVRPALQQNLASANVDLGEKLYMDRCGKCHQLFGKGETVGPKLDSYDRRNLQFWLNAIVAPSIEIREGYQMYQLLTADGRVLTGLIAAQDLNSVSLRQADGQLVTVSADQVDQVQAMKSSLMPEGLLKDLTEHQLLQLFAYLSQAR